MFKFNKNNKILMISDKKHFKFKGNIYSKGGFYLQSNYLGNKLKNLTLMVPVKKINNKPKGNKNTIKNIIELNHFSSPLNLLFEINKSKSKIKKAIKENEIILLRLPSFYSLYSYFISKKYKKKIIFIIVGDWESVAKDFFRIKFISKIYSFSIKYLLKYILKKEILITTGKKLGEKYKSKFNKTYFFISTSITNKDIIIKNKNNKNINKILFVGRISKEKGLIYLIQAINRINKDKTENEKITLTIVGEIIDKKYYKEIIKNHKNKNILFKGLINNRDKLNKIYLEQDLFILPSIMEGTPKVLIEAMSKLLPIIASNVGGIPSIIKNKENGLLIKPKSTKEIIDSINLLKLNSKLKNKIIKNGLNKAKKHTLEIEMNKLIKIILT